MMPWTVEDVEQFKKGLSKHQKERWVRVANSVLKKCMDDGGTDKKCAPIAIKQANGVVNNMEKIIIYKSQTAEYAIETRRFENKKHIVVPVVMMVEGVHHGSHGPLLHLVDELSKFPACWDGIPVMIYHPQIEGKGVPANSPEMLEQSVGRVFNTHMEDGKLKAEVWLDEQRLLAISPVALAYIQEGKPLDVSVGVFTDEEKAEGVYTNESNEEEQYIAIARNYRPDHLALLPGQQGACSWMDGCGVRTNSDSSAVDEGISPISITVNVNENENMKNDELVMAMKQMAREDLLSEVTNNKQGYQELMQLIYNKLDAMDDEDNYHMLEEVYQDSVVYRKRSRTTNETGLFQQSYEIKDDGVIDFVGTPVKVRRNVTYIQVNKMIRTVFNTNKGEESMAENDKPCCLEKVVELIGDKRTHFTPDDKDWLLSMSAEQLEKFTPIDVAPVVEEIPPVQINMDEYVKKDSLQTFEDFLALASDEVKEIMEKGAVLYAEHRSELISNILENAEKGVWTEDELKGFNTDMLEKLSKQFKSVTSYAGQAAGGNPPVVQTNSNEKLLPLGV